MSTRRQVALGREVEHLQQASQRRATQAFDPRPPNHVGPAPTAWPLITWPPRHPGDPEPFEAWAARPWWAPRPHQQ